MEEEMEELCVEGLATHGDPESCVDDPRGRGEALTGARAGRGRIQPVVATVLLIVEVVVLQRRGRLPVPREGRLAFWEAVRAGVPVPDAAAAGGVLRTAETWFRQAGGVKGNGPRGPVSGRYLSVAEREEIAVGVAAGEPLRVIAGRLGRAPSTVSREICRNTGQRGVYRAVA